MVSKQEIVKSIRLMSKIGPELRRDIKLLKEELLHLVRQIPRTKNNPNEFKGLQKKFAKTLIKYHTRMSRKVASKEPSLRTKVGLSLVAIIVIGVAEYVITMCLRNIIPNDDVVEYAQYLFIMPMLEEFFRIYLEYKYHAGLVFTATELLAFPREIKDAIEATDYEMYMFYYDMDEEKARKYARSDRWRSILMSVLAHGINFVNHFIQRYLLRKAEEEDRPKLRVVAYVVSVIISALHRYARHVVYAKREAEYEELSQTTSD